jgi:hypothetical protein
LAGLARLGRRAESTTGGIWMGIGMRYALGAVAVLAAMSTAVGCSKNVPRHREAPAVVVGTASGTLIFGGPGPVRPVPGQVVAVNSAGTQSQVAVGDDGRFSMFLSPGSYQLSGSSPEVTLNGSPVQCGAARSVRITARRITRGIKVTCSLI